MTNSVYGKTMENLGKRINVRLVDKAEDFSKYNSKPTYITHIFFCKDYAVIHEIKPISILNKPIYAAFTVLDLRNGGCMISITILSKIILMLNCCLLTQKVLHMKFSNYRKDETNKKVVGKMKDRFEGVSVDDFVGLKSKMYSMKRIDGKEHNRGKSVNIATEFKKFKDVLFNKKIIRHKMRRTQSKKHKLGTYETAKKSLSSFDDKRLVLYDRVYTLSYFHKNSVKN